MATCLCWARTPLSRSQYSLKANISQTVHPIHSFRCSSGDSGISIAAAAAAAAPRRGCVGRHLAIRAEMRVSGSDSYALLLLFDDWPMKELFKSVNIWQKYGPECAGDLFFYSPCTLGLLSCLLSCVKCHFEYFNSSRCCLATPRLSPLPFINWTGQNPISRCLVATQLLAHSTPGLI